MLLSPLFCQEIISRGYVRDGALLSSVPAAAAAAGTLESHI